MQINSSSNVQRRTVHFFREEVSRGRRWSGLDAAIIIGGIAGWLAEQFMKSDMGLIMNIVLGIVGAAIASAILSYFGIVLGDGSAT